jgi:hypothetical protein
MKISKTLLFAACLSLFIAYEASGQTHEQLIESTKQNLVEVIANLGGVNCGPAKESPCAIGEDRDALLVKKQYLEDYLHEIGGVTGGDTDEDEVAMAAPPSNPAVKATNAKLLAQAEANLSVLKQNPQANADRITAMEARVASLKARIQ